MINVSIADNAYSPADVTVPRGSTVRWTNNDNIMHTVSADSGSPSSMLLNPGDTYQLRFDTVGVFHYHCNVHSGMKGIVRVQ